MKKTEDRGARKRDFLSEFRKLIETPPPRLGKPENWPPSRMKSSLKSKRFEASLTGFKYREAVHEASRYLFRKS